MIERFARFVVVIVMAAMVLAPFGTASAMGSCDGGLMHPTEMHGQHPHGHMGTAETGHMKMRRDAVDHRTAKHQPPCCNTNCLACVPAILAAEPDVPLLPTSFVFAAAIDTFALGLSPLPLLGPPRSLV